jgi:two-component system response regulator QseB/two-component system response regulator TctD
MRILVADDDPRLRKSLSGLLTEAGFAVDWAANADEAAQMAEAVAYAALVVEPALAEGAHLIRSLRAGRPDAPLLALSVRGALEYRVAGLEAGADDYLAKPFAPDELVARLRALLRRPWAEADAWLALGNVRLQPETGVFLVDETETTLSRAQLALMTAFLRHSTQVLTLERLVAALGGEPTGINALHVTISRLRRRLAQTGADVVVETEWNAGYLLRRRDG